jgi:hypothetical protein
MSIEPSNPIRRLDVVAIWIAVAYGHLADGGRSLARRLADDRGVEDSPSKLIFLAVTVAIAIAAGVFIISVFNDAQNNVPDPVAPSP